MARGARIEKVIAQALEREAAVLQPVHKQSVIPEHRVHTHPATNMDMALYFELALQSLFGGRIQEKIQLHDGRDVKIDLLNSSTIYESKAWVSSSHASILDYQVQELIETQIINPEKRISYALFRHTLRSVRSYNGSQEQMFRDLSKSNVYAVVLPFSIMLHLYENRESLREHIYPYTNDTTSYYPATCLRSPLGGELLLEPEQLLSKLELDIAQYTFLRARSPKIEIQGNDVKQFPMMVISDRNHDQWREGFLAQHYNMAQDGCSDGVMQLSSSCTAR